MPCIRFMVRFAAALCLGLAGAVLLGAGRGETVDVVLADDSGIYAEVLGVLKQELAGRASLNVLSAAAVEKGYTSDARLVVTVGVRALQAIRKGGGTTPVIGILIPSAAYGRIVGAGAETPSRAVSAVYLDQPPSRQLNLVRAVASGRHNIGFLVTAESGEALSAFRAAARGQKLSVLEEQIEQPRDLYSALRRLLSESDAVVALPDSVIYNPATIANILITTYRAQQPLFGFSPAYVKAGAIAAVYSTPRQVALQAASCIQRYFSSGRLGPPEYPRQFAVSMNPTVARSLGIEVEDESVVHDRLVQMERE